MPDITKTTRRLIADQVAQNAARELSDCVRALDLAERKTAIGVKFHQRLARIIVGLDKVAPDLRALRAAARRGDRQAAFLVEEFDVQCGERDRLVRRMLTDPALTDPRLTTVATDAKSLRDNSGGLVRWARKVLAEAKATRDVAAKRRQERTTAKPRRTASRRRRAAVLTVKRIASKSGDGSPQVVLTASSDSVDLDGERFSLGALKQMRDGLKGKTSWIGHSYDPSTDVFGRVTGGKLVQQAGRNLLDLTIEVARKSPRAMKVYDLIKSGIKLGASVGVIVLQTAKDKADDVTILDSVRPLEVSIVGLPANWDDAWVQGAKGKRLDNLVVA